MTTPLAATSQEEAAFGLHVEKPWGFETLFTPPWLPYAGKLLNVRAGHRLSLQVHESKTETILLLSGSAVLWLEDALGEVEQVVMVRLQGYTICPGRKHRIAAVTDALLVEASSPEVGTTLRLEDDYGRPDETEAARNARRR